MLYKTVNGALVVLYLLYNKYKGVNTCRYGGIFTAATHHVRVVNNGTRYQGIQVIGTYNEESWIPKPLYNQKNPITRNS